MFRRRGGHGGGGDSVGGGLLADDDMTLGSTTSVGVSDRIMGRMKLSLGGGGSSRSNNVTSSGSVSSAKSSGRFGRRKKQNYRSSQSVSSAGSRSASFSLRSKSTGRFRMNNDASSSSVGVTTMEEMDSNEALTLKGISLGRRRPSAPMVRQQSPKNEEDDGGESRVNEPVELSLAELRSMSESELEKAMLKAGVPSEDISRTKDQVTQLAINNSGTADDKRRGSLVALFVNSGHVKLVQTDRRATLSFINNNSSKSFTEAAIPSSRDNNSSAMSLGASDLTLLETKSKSRKSKLDKITELQSEKSSLKRENKALKKTMKKLLAQLSDSAKEKEALEKKIELNVIEKQPESEIIDDSAKGSLHSVDNDISVATDTDSKTTRRKESSASQRSQDVSLKDMSLLKKKMKKQQQEHKSTEFRLKAEIEILTKEVDGLQRELGLALESVDDAEKRVMEAREASSKLKSKMRTMSSKMKDLTQEADARDKLITTFTNLLLEKVGTENGDAGLTGKLDLAQLVHAGTSMCRIQDESIDK
ncbi:hypothetical protein ACHAWC_011657 [Mediolabrus comicus]